MTGPKPQYPTKEQVAPFIQKAEAEIRVLAAEAEQRVLPITEVMADQAKSLVTLSSSALVLSFSVLQLAHPAALVGTWMLATAWILFALSVTVGAFWHYFYRNSRGYHMRLWMGLQSLRDAMLTTPIGPDFEAQCVAQAERDMNAMTLGNFKAIVTMNRCNSAMSASFTLGLVALVGFAIANLK